MHLKRHKKSSLGFTLIELLVVIAIIALLAAIVLASLNIARAKGRDANRMETTRSVLNALELYYNDNGGYPVGNVNFTISNFCNATDIAGTNAVMQTLVNGGYLSSVPSDPTPITGRLCYRYVSSPAAVGPNGNLAAAASFVFVAETQFTGNSNSIVGVAVGDKNSQQYYGNGFPGISNILLNTGQSYGASFGVGI